MFQKIFQQSAKSFFFISEILLKYSTFHFKKAPIKKIFVGIIQHSMKSKFKSEVVKVINNCFDRVIPVLDTDQKNTQEVNK